MSLLVARAAGTGFTTRLADRMEFGVGYFPTHDAMRPGAVARLVEEHGHESLFFAEHTQVPASRDSQWPGGGELPRKYRHTYDLFVALTAAAEALHGCASLRDRAETSVAFMVMGVPPKAEVLDQLHQAGCRRVAHWVPSAARPLIEQALERWETAIAEFTDAA